MADMYLYLRHKPKEREARLSWSISGISLLASIQKAKTCTEPIMHNQVRLYPRGKPMHISGSSQSNLSDWEDTLAAWHFLLAHAHTHTWNSASACMPHSYIMRDAFWHTQCGGACARSWIKRVSERNVCRERNVCAVKGVCVQYVNTVSGRSVRAGKGVCMQATTW